MVLREREVLRLVRFRRSREEGRKRGGRAWISGERCSRRVRMDTEMVIMICVWVSRGENFKLENTWYLQISFPAWWSA